MPSSIRFVFWRVLILGVTTYFMTFEVNATTLCEEVLGQIRNASSRDEAIGVFGNYLPILNSEETLAVSKKIEETFIEDSGAKNVNATAASRSELSSQNNILKQARLIIVAVQAKNFQEALVLIEDFNKLTENAQQYDSFSETQLQTDIKEHNELMSKIAGLVKDPQNEIIASQLRTTLLYFGTSQVSRHRSYFHRKMDFLQALNKPIILSSFLDKKSRELADDLGTAIEKLDFSSALTNFMPFVATMIDPENLQFLVQDVDDDGNYMSEMFASWFDIYGSVRLFNDVGLDTAQLLGQYHAKTTLVALAASAKDLSSKGHDMRRIQARINFLLAELDRQIAATQITNLEKVWSRLGSQALSLLFPNQRSFVQGRLRVLEARGDKDQLDDYKSAILAWAQLRLPGFLSER